MVTPSIPPEPREGLPDVVDVVAPAEDDAEVGEGPGRRTVGAGRACAVAETPEPLEAAVGVDDVDVDVDVDAFFGVDAGDCDGVATLIVLEVVAGVIAVAAAVAAAATVVLVLVARASVLA